MNQVVITQLKLNWFQKYRINKKIHKNLKKHLYCIGDIKSTYHKEVFLQNHSEFKCIENKVNIISNKIFKRSFKIANMWANVGSYGSEIKPHNHIRDDFSDFESDDYFKTFGICGAFYLKKPKLSGNFIADGNVVNVSEGDLIFFSPHIMHWTEINRSYKNRTVISFNGYLI